MGRAGTDSVPTKGREGELEQVLFQYMVVSLGERACFKGRARLNSKPGLAGTKLVNSKFMGAEARTPVARKKYPCM